MGIRFQKRLTVFPGLRLNFSLRGVSLTAGPRGASINVGAAGPFLNLGIPGTGLSTRLRLNPQGGDAEHVVPSSDLTDPADHHPQAVQHSPATEYVSQPVGSLTGSALLGMRELFAAVASRRGALTKECERAGREHSECSRALNNLSRSPLARFERTYLAQLAKHVDIVANAKSTLEALLQGSVIDVTFGVGRDAAVEFSRVTTTFDQLSRAAVIWDVSRSVEQDRMVTRSLAARQISREPVTFRAADEDIFAGDVRLLQLGNANGGTIILTPAFALVREGPTFDVIDIRQLTIDGGVTKFIEDGEVPRDAKVIGETWERVNKDGSPDRRFKDNRSIPLVQYGELSLTTETGLNERYLVSDAAVAGRFATALKAYQSVLRKGETTAGDAEPNDSSTDENEFGLPDLEVPTLPSRPRRPVLSRAILIASGITTVLASALLLGKVQVASRNQTERQTADTVRPKTPQAEQTINRETAPTPSPSVASDLEARPLTRAELAETQRLLASQGFALGTADGIPGPRTRAAANKMRARLGLPATNEIDLELLSALRKAAQQTRGN